MERQNRLKDNQGKKLFQVQISKCIFYTHGQTLHISLTNVPKWDGWICRWVFSLLGEGEAFQGALTVFPPHSLPLTLHLFPRQERQTEKNLLGTLTGLSVPGEQEGKIGAGDGDHLADVSVGPTGDLLPHPTASWKQIVSKHADKLREAVVRHLVHTNTLKVGICFSSGELVVPLLRQPSSETPG